MVEPRVTGRSSTGAPPDQRPFTGIDLTGRRYGCWTVLNYAEKRRWYVRCDCGHARVVSGASLRGGHSRSCGCCGCKGLQPTTTCVGPPRFMNTQRRAHSAVSQAVRRGVLVKPNRCETCHRLTERQKLHGHHRWGYAPENRLRVAWLCRSCHIYEHMKTDWEADYAFVTDMLRSGEARQLREQAGVSISDVARSIGVTPSSVSRWEHWGALPSSGEHASAYARILRALRKREAA